MINKLNLRFIIFSGLALTLSVVVLASSVPKKHAPRPASETTAVRTMSQDDSLRYKYYFLRAFYCEGRGDMTSSFDLLEYCRRINPNAPELNYYRSLLLSAINKDSLSEQAIRKAVSLDPKNNTYLQTLAMYYANNGQVKKAIDICEQLARNTQDRDDVLQTLLQLYAIDKNYNGQLNVLDRMETAEGPSEEITLSKMQVYENRGQKKKALQVLRDLCSKYSNDPSYQVMLANWLENNGEHDEAYKILNKILKEEPDNNEAQLSLLDYYTNTKDTVQEELLRDRILFNKRTPSETKMALLLKATKQYITDSARVIRLYDRVLKASPLPDVALLKAEYLRQMNAPTPVLNEALNYTLQLQPDNDRARLLLLVNYFDEAARNSQKRDSLYALLIKQGETGVAVNPRKVEFYHLIGLTHQIKNEDDEALDAYRRGTEMAGKKDNAEIVGEMYGNMGDIYYEKKMPEKAFQCYDSCLQWNPKNVSVLNNYAYYLSTEGKQLDKAEKMAGMAVNEEPNEANYLDTYAWIFYQEGKYDQARTYIDMCLAKKNLSEEDSMAVADTAAIADSTAIADSIAQDSVENASDATFYDHAGDIYSKLGLTDEARGFWQKALDRRPGDEALERKLGLKPKENKPKPNPKRR